MHIGLPVSHYPAASGRTNYPNRPPQGTAHIAKSSHNLKIAAVRSFLSYVVPRSGMDGYPLATEALWVDPGRAITDQYAVRIRLAIHEVFSTFIRRSRGCDVPFPFSQPSLENAVVFDAFWPIIGRDKAGSNHILT
jgi:hypothetical protein